MSPHRITLPTLLAVAVLCAGAPPLRAHSGNSGIRVEQQTVIALCEDAIAITYTSELNRQGAYLEVLRMDRDGDGRFSSQEQARYFARLHKAVVGGLELSVNGREVPLVPIGQVELLMPFRKTYRFEVPQPPDWEEGAVVEFHNDNYLDFRGAITIQLDPGSAADVVYDSRRHQEQEQVQDAAVTAGLDPQQRDVVFRYRRGTGKHETPEDADAATSDAPSGPAAGDDARGDANPPSRAMVMVVLAIVVPLCMLLLVIGRAGGTRARRVAAGSAVLLALAAGLLAWQSAAFSRPGAQTAAVPSDVEAGQIFQELHRHVYRALEARTESDVYDTLARGLDGAVLDEVYQEVYEALMMRGEGNTRFSVRRVKPISTEVLPADAAVRPAFRVRYRWRVYGTVTHFGHTHARFNEYEALYLVQHNGRAWRITDSQVRQNKRVTIGQT